MSTDAPAAATTFQRLAAAVTEIKAGHPLARVTVIAPRLTWGSGLREGLARQFPETGIANVEMLTASHLAHVLAAPHLPVDAMEIDEPALVAAVRLVLQESPGFFQPVADHPSTVDELSGRAAALSRFTPQLREALAATGARAQDVNDVCGAALAGLSTGHLDEAQVTDLAIEVIERADESELYRTVGIGVVVLDAGLRPPREQRFLDALATRLSVSHIAWASTDASAGFAINAEHVECVTTTDPEEEVRVAVRTVVGALADDPQARCVIIRPSRKPYSRMLREHLGSAGIASYDPDGMIVTESLAFRLLSHLADLDPDSLALPEVMRLLRAVPLRTPDGGSPSVQRWRTLAAEAGAHGSDLEWVARLEESAKAKEAEVIEIASREGDEDAETAEWSVERLRRDAEQLRRLGRFVDALGATLRSGRLAASWQELSAWADVAISDMLDLGHGGNAAQPNRAAASVVRDVVARLGETASIEPSPETLVAELRLLLDDASIAIGSSSAGVTCLDPARAASIASDVLVVLGLSEGVLPSPNVEDLWWTDKAIDELRKHPNAELAAEAAALLPTGRDRIAITGRMLRTAVASAGSRLVFTRPKGDLRGTVHRSPSRWWLPLIDAARASGVEPLERDVHSQGEGLREAEHPASASEARARTLLLASQGRPTSEALAAVDGNSSTLVDTRELRIARASNDYTAFDGRLEPVGNDSCRVSLADPDVELSASRIATYLSCPWKYAVTYELGVPEPEDDELAFQQGISPARLGFLAHEVFEKYVLERLEAGAELPARWDIDTIDRLLEILDRDFAALGPEVVGREAVADASRQLAENLVLNWPDQDSAWRAGIGPLADMDVTSTPALMERRFGVLWSDRGSDDVPVVVGLGDGREVRFRGKIDRLDVLSDGRFGVLDYKTGRPKNLKQVQEPQNLFQLSVYVAAARALVAAGHVPGVTDVDNPVVGYWYVASEGEAALQTLIYEDRHYDQFVSILREVVDLVDAGIFPPGHTKAGYSGWVCPFCQSLGFAHARRIHRLKSEDPLLARALELTEDPETFVSGTGEAP